MISVSLRWWEALVKGGKYRRSNVAAAGISPANRDDMVRAL